jgi:single-stranded-DNA-specific exonuclease
LEPFGPGNPAPIFVTRGLRVVDCQRVGGDHLRIHLIGPDTHLTGMAFGQAEVPLAPGEKVDLVYRLRRKAWRGRIAPELEVLDWRPATNAPADFCPTRSRRAGPSEDGGVLGDLPHADAQDGKRMRV